MPWPTPERGCNRRAVRATALAVVAALLCGPLPAAAEKLVPLVCGLEWSGVSGLIGYQGRLWFANSVKFVNHNSADVYSYHPQTGRARYEKHLFSQDAGDPVVAGGLLYGPFEDARFSPGRGEFMVTDGKTGAGMCCRRAVRFTPMPWPRWAAPSMPPVRRGGRGCCDRATSVPAGNRSTFTRHLTGR